MTPEMILIRIQPTPNPNALKFVVNKAVKASGKATFTRPSEALGLRLAEDLFLIEGVRQLHFFENVVTVTYADDADVDTLQLEVQAVLQTRMPSHDPGFLVEEEKKKIDRSNLPQELQTSEVRESPLGSSLSRGVWNVPEFNWRNARRNSGHTSGKVRSSNSGRSRLTRRK